MTTTRRQASGGGCLDNVDSVTPVNEFLPERVASEFTTQDGVPLTLDASRPLSGVVTISSLIGTRNTSTGEETGAGAGLTTVDVTVTGVEVGASEVVRTLGSATESYTATPAQNWYQVPWSAEIAEQWDRRDFASLTLSVVVRGFNVSLIPKLPVAAQG